jgi:hypothetical protein
MVNLNKAPAAIADFGAVAARNLSRVRALVKDYYKNRTKYVDFDNMRHYDDNEYIVTVRSFESVTGLCKLGSGHYSDVYDLDHGRCLKIVKSTDSSYASFVRFIKAEGYKYSCFPKIFYSGNWGGKEVYVIEKMANSYDTESDRRFLADYCRKFFGRDSYPVSRFVKVPQEFEDGLTALKEYFEKSRRTDSLGFDIHADNVMLRENGDPVITDPFS